MTLFAITVYGQCCRRRHVVGQQVVSNVNVVRSCWSIGSLRSEANNTNLLLGLRCIALLGMSILLHIPNMFCPTTCGVYSVITDRETDKRIICSVIVYVGLLSRK